MCFYIDNKHPDKKIAKRDITCYKILFKYYRSIYQLKYYELNKIYKDRIGKIYLTFEKENGIDEGFHSYSSQKRAITKRKQAIKECRTASTEGFIIVKCIIPKGSEYYYNPIRHEYVSNQIIVREVIKQ